MEIQKKYVYFSVGVTAGLVILYFGTKWLADKFDVINKFKMSSLDPSFRKKVEKLIKKAAQKGIKLRIVSSYRSCSQQNELYSKGRTKPGYIVTNAKCGYSHHNFRVAVDVVELKDGKPLWKNPRWNEIGRIGESVGLKWGGRWTSFLDRPHFYDTNGRSLAELRGQYKISKV